MAMLITRPSMHTCMPRKRISGYPMLVMRDTHVSVFTRGVRRHWLDLRAASVCVWGGTQLTDTKVKGLPEQRQMVQRCCGPNTSHVPLTTFLAPPVPTRAPHPDTPPTDPPTGSGPPEDESIEALFARLGIAEDHARAFREAEVGVSALRLLQVGSCCKEKHVPTD